MKTILLFIFCMSLLFCMSITACVSPYQGQANALTQAYQNGLISANDYFARMAELQALDLQRRQAIAQAWQRGCDDMANSYQQRAIQLQSQQRANRPTYGSGTIMTPTGQTYFYNYNQH